MKLKNTETKLIFLPLFFPPFWRLIIECWNLSHFGYVISRHYDIDMCLLTHKNNDVVSKFHSHKRKSRRLCVYMFTTIMHYSHCTYIFMVCSTNYVHGLWMYKLISYFFLSIINFKGIHPCVTLYRIKVLLTFFCWVKQSTLRMIFI